MGVASAPTLHAVRRAIKASTDPRTVRTRAAIFGAVERLVGEGQTPLGVGDIVAAAGISRTTFYSHFATLDEFALQVLIRAYARAADSHDHSNPVRGAALIAALVAHYLENRALYQGVLAMPLSRSVHTRAARALAASIEPIVTVSSRPSNVTAPLASTYIASAIVGFLDEWLEGEFDATGPELITHLTALLPDWFVSSSTPS